MICHLFAWSAWAQTANVEAVITGEGAALSSSLDRHGFCQPLCWRAQYVRALLCPLFVVLRGLSLPLRSWERQVSALLCPLFPFWAWDLPASMVSGTAVVGAALTSDTLVGVGSQSHRVCWHDR